MVKAVFSQQCPFTQKKGNIYIYSGNIMAIEIIYTDSGRDGRYSRELPCFPSHWASF
jgi:hypothetical protein